MYNQNHFVDYVSKLSSVLMSVDKIKVSLLVELITKLNFEKKVLFIAGNGGSAATASHLVCDFGKTALGKKPRENSKRLKVISLSDNIPCVTAWANDEGYKYIFSEQLKNLGQSGDLLLVITGSGNSENILELLSTSKSLGIKTFGLLGFDGGKAKDLVDDYLLINSFDYGIVEDAHMILGHIITDWFKNSLI